MNMEVIMMNKVYLVLEEYCFDYETSKNITVFSTLEKAQKYAKEMVDRVVKENHFNSGIAENYYYEGYDEGYYAENHICMYIEVKEVE